MTTHLIIGDPHAKPDEDLKRADLLSKLMDDLRPDVVVNIGDHMELNSLSSFDKGKGSFASASYEADVYAGLEFNDRMFASNANCRRVILHGNHEHRLTRTLEWDHQYLGSGRFGLSFRDWEYETYYSDVVRYEGATPGTIEIDGIVYCHYLASGPMGRPVAGVNHGRSLLLKGYQSVTVGHSHFLDFATLVDASGKRLMGLVAGCFKGPKPDAYAGTASRSYWRGVIIKRQVENGSYDPQFVSMRQLEAEYS